MNKAYLLIGGNLGDRERFLAAAREKIEQDCGPVLQQSPLYETAAWGQEDQDAFLNQALEITTARGAEDLLKRILFIEEKLGRVRQVKYGPRIIDIDILLYNDDVVKKEDLIIPHPQLPFRRFALAPLADIAPDYLHPVLKKTIGQLLKDCPDKLDVHKIY